MRFSVVTPSLDQARWLPDCLASVRSQEDVDVEHLVIDGGSTDDTTSLLAQQHFAKWISEPDHGQTDAINKGFKLATGDILAYLCADDFYEARALQEVARIFREKPEADVVYGDGYFLEGESGWKRLKRAGPLASERLRHHNAFIQPAVFLRRRVWERFGPLDAKLKFCMDHEYWLRIRSDVRWQYVPRPLATCRLHGEAKTSRALAAAWAEAAQMQRRYGRRLAPAAAALWMRLIGQHYYFAKRRLFCALGRFRTKGTDA